MSVSKGAVKLADEDGKGGGRYTIECFSDRPRGQVVSSAIVRHPGNGSPAVWLRFTSEPKTALYKKGSRVVVPLSLLSE